MIALFANSIAIFLRRTKYGSSLNHMIRKNI